MTDGKKKKKPYSEISKVTRITKEEFDNRTDKLWMTAFYVCDDCWRIVSARHNVCPDCRSRNLVLHPNFVKFYEEE